MKSESTPVEIEQTEEKKKEEKPHVSVVLANMIRESRARKAAAAEE